MIKNSAISLSLESPVLVVLKIQNLVPCQNIPLGSLWPYRWALGVVLTPASMGERRNEGAGQLFFLIWFRVPLAGQTSVQYLFRYVCTSQDLSSQRT